MERSRTQSGQPGSAGSLKFCGRKTLHVNRILSHGQGMVGGEGVGYCTRAGCVPRNASVGDWAGRESKGSGSLRQPRVAATHGAAVPRAAGKRGAAGPPIWGAGQPGGRRSPGAVGTQRGTPAPRPLTRRPAAITRAQEAAPHRATPSPAPPPLTQSPPEDRDRHSPRFFSPLIIKFKKIKIHLFCLLDCGDFFF